MQMRRSLNSEQSTNNNSYPSHHRSKIAFFQINATHIEIIKSKRPTVNYRLEFS